MSRVEKALSLPVTADGMRFQRLRANLQSAIVRGDDACQRRLEAELDELGAKLGVDRRGRAVGKTAGEDKVARGTGRDDVIDRLLRAGHIGPEHAQTADRLRAVIEALLIGSVRSVDFDGLEPVSGGRDPLSKWARGHVARAGGDRVTDAPRMFGWKRARTVRGGGDGVTDRRAEVLQDARRVGRVLGLLERECKASARRLERERKRADLERKARAECLRQGKVFEPFNPSPVTCLLVGEAPPIASQVLTDVVLDGLAIRPVAVKRVGNDGPKARNEVIRALLHGLEFVADSGVLHTNRATS